MVGIDVASYRVPSMSEINSLPLNGRVVASFFSGCGGSSLGYRMAGFRVGYANEFIPSARETYRSNFPSTEIDERDIRTVDPAEVLSKLGLAPGELDILDGSPPCASFSTNGIVEDGWGRVKIYSDTKQRVDDLFYEYIRMVDAIRPRVFVAENVSGLVKGKAKGVFLNVLERLKGCGGGYEVKVKLLDASYLGVPQARQRLIFIGVRSDLQLGPVFPKPLAVRYSLRDALSNMTKNHVERETDMSRYEISRYVKKIELFGISEKRFNLCRPRLDRPCPTVVTKFGDPSAASVFHPFEDRKFSIDELRRICGFPEDFILCGSFKKQAERLGRAVPPVLMSHVAMTLLREVFGRMTEGRGR